MGTYSLVYKQRLHCLVSLDWAGARQQELMFLFITPNLSRITPGQQQTLFLKGHILMKLVLLLSYLLDESFGYFFHVHKHKSNFSLQCFRPWPSYLCYKGSIFIDMMNCGSLLAISL